MIEKLLASRDPYSAITTDDDALFAAAMGEADTWHVAKNERYAKLWDGSMRPLIPVGLFKQVDLATHVDQPGAWMSSSGTTSGSSTRVFFDQLSMSRIQRAMIQVFYAHRLIGTKPSNFLLLSPDPASGVHPGYATTFLKFTACAPVAERVFAVDASGKLMTEVALATLRRWAKSDAPIYLFGLTVYFEHLALAGLPYIEMNAPVRGLTGGGWKGLVKQLARDEIIARLGDLVHSTQVDIRDLFGLTEHPVHYVSCSFGNFHVPKYGRFSIDDGLIRLQSPLFASLPSHDLLTEDRGEWIECCPCNSPLPGFRFLGRVTSSEGTCAWDATR